MRSEKGGIHIVWFKCASEYRKIKNNVSNAEKEYIFNIIYILLTNYILILEFVFFFCPIRHKMYYVDGPFGFLFCCSVISLLVWCLVWINDILGILILIF